jgi:hypothetical protein
MLRAEVRRLRRAAWIISGSGDPPGSSAPRIPSSSNPRIPFTPRASFVPSTPRASCVPSTPRASWVPSTPRVPCVPSTPAAPGSPSTPAGPGSPSTPAGPGSPSEPETPGIAVGSLISGPSDSAIPGIPLAPPVSHVSSALRGSRVSSVPHAWWAPGASASGGSLLSGGRGGRGGSTSSRSGQGTGCWVIGGASNLATKSRHAASSSRSLLSVLSQSGTSPPLCE